MALTQKPQVTPSLNEDVLRDIFSHLPNERRTLGAVRLASHTLKRTATPFFITRASFAFRLPSWIRLHWLINHQEFSKTIKEFVFDASVYEPYAAMSEYLSDPSALEYWWDTRKSQKPSGKRDLLSIAVLPAWPEISCLDQYQSAQDRDTSFKQKLQQSAVLLSSATQGIPTQLQRHLLYCLTHSITHPSIEAVGLKVCRNLLRAAFGKLRNLKHLVVGDFRDCAYHQESYSALYGRMFGYHPAPRLPSTVRARSYDCYDKYRQELWDCAGEVSWISFTTAKGGAFEPETGKYLWQQPACMMVSLSLEVSLRCMSSLVDIRLSIGFEPDGYESPGDFVSALSGACPKLRSLSLELKCFVPLSEISPGESRDPPMFPAQSCAFPALELLHLKGWAITAQLWRDILSRHKSTLRSVDLSCCMIGITEADVEEGQERSVSPGAIVDASFQKFVDEHMTLEHYSLL